MTLERITEELVSILGTGKQLVPYSTGPGGISVQEAYWVSKDVRDRRLNAGASAAGRKLGFTNRRTWAHFEPMWNYMFSDTVHFMSDASFSLSLHGLPEPRIEPEIALFLRRSPVPGMELQELADCIDWIAPAFEIVQSVYPGWAFSAPDAIAAYGLHGALVVGSPVYRNGSDLESGDALQNITVELARDGETVEAGHSRNVMGGPLQALSYLVETLARQDLHPPLAAGEIVATGTLTAVPGICAAELWTASYSLGGASTISVRFVE